MVKGACLCGAVRYEIDGPLRSLTHCHCSMCRKHHGTAFSTFAGARLTGFRWVSGEDRITRFESSANGERSSCSTCGSVTPILLPALGMVLAPAGNLVGDLGIRPDAHIFVGSKAPWYTITDNLPRHEEYPPEWGMAGVSRPILPPAQDAVRGSCLCGDVAFEISSEPQRMMYCHCTRCRRGRSAAHASNLFYKMDGFRWTRGEAQVACYKLPEAKYFAVGFCRRCGGALPHLSPERGAAIVPAGALDDDPGMRAQAHIFVANKASWFEITDQMPQYPEMLTK
ncbi:MAG: GFA family protein [Sulfurifustis sp.]